jgi:hypothetical protein
MNNYLNQSEWLHAVFMWHGGSDTLTIAKYFGCSESLIYAKLPHYRNKHRAVREVAA